MAQQENNLCERLNCSMTPGLPEKPVVILIHGLGMTRHFWSDPETCQVLGGLAPLTTFLNDSPPATPSAGIFRGTSTASRHGFLELLTRDGFTVAAWNQTQPLGPIAVAVDELGLVLQRVQQQWPGKPVYLIGHSRGGLIARKYLQENSKCKIAGLVTLCSPHRGTRLAEFGSYLTRSGPLLARILPQKAQGALGLALQRLAIFLQSQAIDELKPDSPFINSLTRPPDTATLSIGGTSPALFTLYLRVKYGQDWKLLSFPEILLTPLPTNRLPEELKQGAGDGLVTSTSAELPNADHYNFNVNHVQAAYSPKIQEVVRDFLNRCG